MQIPQMTITALILGLTLVATFSTTALAGCGHRGGVDAETAHKFVTWKVDDTLDELEAEEAQRTHVHEVKDALFAEGLTLRERSHASRDLIIEQLLSDAPDAALMHAEVDALIDELRAFAHSAVDGVVDVHGTLTPEQRAELVEMFDGAIQRWREQRLQK